MVVIKKGRKFLFQFPEGTETAKQAEYMDKLNKSLEVDDFAVVDPKIKVFPRDIIDEIKDPADDIKNEEKTEAEPDKKEDSVAEPEKKEEATPPAETATKIEKVESKAPAPEAPEKTALQVEENASSTE